MSPLLACVVLAVHNDSSV